MLVKECNILGNKAYALRASVTQHNIDILEIVSNVNFREKYKLKDDDIIYINF